MRKTHDEKKQLAGNENSKLYPDTHLEMVILPFRFRIQQEIQFQLNNAASRHQKSYVPDVFIFRFARKKNAVQLTVSDARAEKWRL